MTTPTQPLPALPEPDVHDAAGYRRAFSAEQMRAYARAALAAHPQHPAPQPLTDEQLERHTLSARDCPPDSQVMLVSTISRLRGISAAQVAPAAGRRHLTLASPELADDMARLKARIASEPGFALSLLVQAGIATVDGQLAPEYGGPAPTTREG